MEKNICKNCGHENFEHVTVCYACKWPLVEGAEEKKAKSNESLASSLSSNKVAALIKLTAIILFAMGCFISLALMSDMSMYGGSLISVLMALVSTVIASLIFYGFGEIIELLSQANDIRRATLETLKEKK